MINKPFFSIVIPTYNSENVIERALKSVFNQTCQDFEIIIIDNSSIDNTKKIISKFKQKKIKIYDVNNNGVIGFSRNKGIYFSSAKWVSFLDSDDTWEPLKLKSDKSAIEKNSEINLVCHNEWQISKNKKKKLYYGPASKNMHKKLIFEGNCLSTSAVTVRRDTAIDAGGFSERKDFITVEDYEFWIRLSKEGNFFYIDKFLGSWYSYKGSESSNTTLHANALISVIQHHLNLWLLKFKDDSKIVKYRKSNMFLSVAIIYFKDHCFKDAIFFSKKSIGLNFLQFKSWAILALSIIKYKS